MKEFLVAVLLYCFYDQSEAKPSQKIIDSCLNTESTSKTVTYHELERSGFSIEEDEDARKISTTMSYGKNKAGVWEVRSSKTFGLVFNGKEIPLKKVIRLDQRHPPSEFNIYKAVWGEAREGGAKYLCITFNFDGIGQSGSFQNVRGVYLIDQKAHAFRPFYLVGEVRRIDK